MVMHSLRSRTYKDPEAVQARAETLRGLEVSGVIISNSAQETALASADSLDAIVCVLEGVDFLRGNANAPEHEALTAKEGCTWNTCWFQNLRAYKKFEVHEQSMRLGSYPAILSLLWIIE